MKLAKLLTIIFLLSITGNVRAQDWARVTRHYNTYGAKWSFPYELEQVSYFDFSQDGQKLYIHPNVDGEVENQDITFDVKSLDNIEFVDETPEEEQTHDKYKVFTLNITTENGVNVRSKDEYVNCYISLDGKGEYNDFSGSARIRGRGNSTWEWYDKKPYRIKLDKKHKMLGLGKEKDWVLLANYRDPTDLMNAFMFEVADWMGMKYVNNTRFVEVFLNGDYRGVYQLTEQVEQGENRVEVADEGGILLGIDLDDGPGLSPDANDNFWSPIFSMPICVKYPDEPTEEQLDEIRNLMMPLEQAINDADYDALDELMDMKSFMTMAMLQEYAENVEICAPRSVYMYKDAGGKWFMGPFWDWDAGYDFNWNAPDMYSSHTFFDDYRELVLGSDPAKRKGMYGSTPKFFTNMFNNTRYVREYKELWNSVKDSIFTRNWEVMERYVKNLLDGPYERDFLRWPIKKYTYWGLEDIDVEEEIDNMKTWLMNRTDYLTKIINAYPEYDGPDVDDYGVIDTSVSGSVITINAMMRQQDGYGQNFRINVDKSIVASLLGVAENKLNQSSIDLVPLNSDGSVGRNTAAGMYGAWFDKRGDTNDWGRGHVYIESNDLFVWSCGCHPDNCSSGDIHTVSMQYRLRSGSQPVVTVKVNFGIDTKPVH